MVGLTGGIGAGKSVAARGLAGRGAIVIDADLLAREVVAPGTEGLRQVVGAFGAGVLAGDGALDRAALGARVFADEAARRRLEGIIHPRVRARTEELVAAAPPDAVIVNDVPLLVEGGLAPLYHLVLVVRAPEVTRVVRLVQDRGMTEAEARIRIHAQTTDERRRAAADVVLDNDGPLDDLDTWLDRLWRERLLPYEENVRLRRPARHDREAPVVPYDPTWPQQYARLAARIARVAEGRRVDHVGPTAVPGTPAKDIIDIQLTVDALAEADRLAGALASAGFFRAAAGAEEHVYGSADPGRAARLYARLAGGPGWQPARVP